MALGAFGELVGQFNNGVSLASGQFVTPTTDNAGRLMVVNSGVFATQDNGTNTTTIAAAYVSQGTALGSTKVLLEGASVTTAAPAYTNGQISPLSLTTSGLLRTDAGVPIGTGTAGTSTQLNAGAVTTAAPTYITGTINPVSLKTTGSLRTETSEWFGSTAPTVGSKTSANSIPVVIASDQGAVSVSLAANQSVNVAQINGVTPLMGNGTTGTGSQRVTIASDNTAFTVNAAQSGTWNVGITGTVALASDAARDSTLKNILLLAPQSAYSSTTSSGIAVFGSVTTAAPSYTTGQVDPFSLTTSGLLRVDGVYPQATGTTSQSLHFVGGATTTSAPTYVTGTINPLSVDTTGNLRTTAALYEQGTNADTSSNSGTGVPITVTGSATDVVTKSVGAGTTMYITGITVAADQAASFELIEFNGAAATTWYRTGLISPANPTLSFTFPEAIVKTGAASHSVKIRMACLNGSSCNGMAAINGYTR